MDVGVPVTRWSAALLAGHLRAQGVDVSERSVGRILQLANLQPHRQRMWLFPKDDEHDRKRDDVLSVYYDAPAHHHVLCLDEKTSMQALERDHADAPVRPGLPTLREFEYTRRGTLCLMGGYDVRRRKLFGFVEERRGGDVFVDLLDVVDRCYPTGRGHIIVDNLSDHDTPDVHEWFDEHPRWTLHFTPRHASWLNQIECAFSILGRQLLARGSFHSVDALKDAIYRWMLWFNAQQQPPFHWTYRPSARA